MTDRISADPGRIKLTSETDGSSEFFTMEMADNPMEPGTPLQKRTLLSDTTEDLIFGDHQNRTVDEALAETGGNRLRFDSSLGQKLYSATAKDTKCIDIDKDDVFFTLKDAALHTPSSVNSINPTLEIGSKWYGRASNVGQAFLITKDYYVCSDYYNTSSSIPLKIYKRTNPNVLFKTITVSYVVSGSSYATLDIAGSNSDRRSNIIKLGWSYNTSSAYYSLLNIDNEVHVTGVGDIVPLYANSTYYYCCKTTTSSYDTIYKYTISDLSSVTFLNIRSTYGQVVNIVSSNTAVTYFITGAVGSSTYKLVTVNLSSQTHSSKNISGAPVLNPSTSDVLTSPRNVAYWIMNDIPGDYVYFIYGHTTVTGSGVSYTLAFTSTLYKIKLSTAVCSSVRQDTCTKTATSLTSRSIYGDPICYSIYYGNLDNNIAIFGTTSIGYYYGSYDDVRTFIDSNIAYGIAFLNPSTGTIVNTFELNYGRSYTMPTSYLSYQDRKIKMTYPEDIEMVPIGIDGIWLKKENGIWSTNNYVYIRSNLGYSSINGFFDGTHIYLVTAVGAEIAQWTYSGSSFSVNIYSYSFVCSLTIDNFIDNIGYELGMIRPGIK